MATSENIGDTANVNNTDSDLQQTMEVPRPDGPYNPDTAVLRALPVPDSKLVRAQRYGSSHWGHTAKLTIELSHGEEADYFLKVVDMGEFGRKMCLGEFEALREIHKVCPQSAPVPYSIGVFDADPSKHFLLMSFREISRQPATPAKLVSILCDLHEKSISPTGKFGFHVATCHTRIVQAVEGWDESWCVVFQRHLGHILRIASDTLKCSRFERLAQLTLEHVVPRLLLPVQTGANPIRPVLLHGDCWDGNTAIDVHGDAFFFDVCSLYGHNEYDTGDWRTPRHLLSHPDYISAYKKRIPPSEPVGEWADRNVLYSLAFNVANALYVPGSTQKPVIYEDMTYLCQKYCGQRLGQSSG